MAHLVNLAEDLALKTATERLAKHLYQLGVAAGGVKAEEVLLSRDRLPEEELASILGTVRVHISRSLASSTGSPVALREDSMCTAAPSSCGMNKVSQAHQVYRTLGRCACGASFRRR